MNNGYPENHCFTDPCCGNEGECKNRNSAPEMTSNEAFVKAIRTIDEAVSTLLEESKEPAVRFAHDLTTVSPLVDMMTQSQALVVAEYLEAEMKALSAKIQESVNNAFA